MSSRYPALAYPPERFHVTMRQDKNDRLKTKRDAKYDEENPSAGRALAI
jgi:hypothetical protein